MRSVPTLAPHSLAGELGLSIHSLSGTRKVSGSGSRGGYGKVTEQEVRKPMVCQRWPHGGGSHAKATHRG